MDGEGENVHDTKNLRIISADNFRKGKQIAKGSFGDIYKATHKETGAECSIIIVKLSSSYDLKDICQRFNACSKLSHRNIIEYLNISFDTGNHSIDEPFYVNDTFIIYGDESIYQPKFACIQMNECTQSLSDYMIEYGGVNQETRIDIMHQIVNGSYYLSSRGFNHINLNWDFIIFDENYEIKLLYFMPLNPINCTTEGRTRMNFNYEEKEIVYNLGLVWLQICLNIEKDSDLFVKLLFNFRNGNVPNYAKNFITENESIILANVLTKDTERRYSLNAVRNFMNEKLPNAGGIYGLKMVHGENKVNLRGKEMANYVEPRVFAQESKEHNERQNDFDQMEINHASHKYPNKKSSGEHKPESHGNKKVEKDRIPIKSIAQQISKSNENCDFDNRKNNNTRNNSSNRQQSNNNSNTSTVNVAHNTEMGMASYLLDKHVESRNKAYEAGLEAGKTSHTTGHNEGSRSSSENFIRCHNISEGHAHFGSQKKYDVDNSNEDNCQHPQSEAHAMLRELKKINALSQKQAYEHGLASAIADARHKEFLERLERDNQKRMQNSCTIS
ncbi:Serine/Threonine kinase domain protein-like protein [Leptotrombidium deliense]|uniref:Serine/Threonine kinase domain protein-like protein n=1 Tax=Leptotrombidium deliense TaxID=299467 RepID=A0A443SBW3_9ACAR|nr:Serine/Threonine kinase domain protein-like protein [Leptotrombidium deliense]